MDRHRYHALTRAWTYRPSRRDVLRGLTGMGLGYGVARLPEAADARKKRKGKKRKKAKPNAFGCVEVGDACKNADQCCSGICAGKRGKKQCGAHGAGTCNQAAQGACEAAFPTQTACNNNVDCRCLHTTAGSNFCAAFDQEITCADCRRDADCEELGLPAGSACIPFSTGFCAGICESGMVCLPPCGVASG